MLNLNLDQRNSRGKLIEVLLFYNIQMNRYGITTTTTTIIILPLNAEMNLS